MADDVTQAGTTPNTSEEGSVAKPDVTTEGVTIEAKTEPAPDAGDKPAKVDEASDKGDESKPAVLGAPEKYEITSPGAQFDATVMETFETIARELDLSQHATQVLADRIGPVIAQRTLEYQVEQFNLLRTQWTEQAIADPELGNGDRKEFDRMNAVAKTALDTFGGEALTALLAETGFGDHPEVIRAFYKIGTKISPDNFVGGDGGRPAEQRTHASVLYPKH